MEYGVRRLTPTECERLQGYPDGWTDLGDWTDTHGKKHNNADSPRYKALENSVAIPCVLQFMKGINQNWRNIMEQMTVNNQGGKQHEEKFRCQAIPPKAIRKMSDIYCLADIDNMPLSGEEKTNASREKITQEESRMELHLQVL